jgi:hypothetical protein
MRCHSDERCPLVDQCDGKLEYEGSAGRRRVFHPNRTVVHFDDDLGKSKPHTVHSSGRALLDRACIGVEDVLPSGDRNLMPIAVDAQSCDAPLPTMGRESMFCSQSGAGRSSPSWLPPLSGSSNRREWVASRRNS